MTSQGTLHTITKILVDLAFISDSLYTYTYTYIGDFKVLPQPEFSDHCKIVLLINNMKPIKTKQNNYKWLDLKPEYKWYKDRPGKFQAALNSDKIKSIINNCRQRIEAGVIEYSGELLQTILQEAADLSLVKKEAKSIPTKLKKRPMKSPKKWFDKDCIKLKSLTNKHKQPCNKSLQDYHKKIC